MLLPMGRSLFDEIFDYPEYHFGYRNTELMKTDVKDMGDTYEVTIDMPGVKKENMKAELEDGYLTVSATTGYENDEKNENGRYIRQERYSGSFSRRFYVGENVTQEEIKAKFENGTLMLFIPKKDQTPQVEQKKYISIEG